MKARTLASLLRYYSRPNDTACWLWLRARDPFGYGRFWFNGGMRLAHRVVYELHRGPIPDGMPLDHLCRVTSCVNPNHLEPVTHLENVRRGNSGRTSAQKTECPTGHPYSEANTYLNGGRRFCRACHNARTRERKQQLALAKQTKERDSNGCK